MNTESRGDLRRELQGLGSSRRARALFVRIQDVVTEILGSEHDHAITADARIFDLGLSSLVVIDLKSRLEFALDVRELPVTLFFRHSSLQELSEYILAEIDPPSVESLNVGQSAFDGADDLRDIAALSEEEATVRMLAKLQELENETEP